MSNNSGKSHAVILVFIHSFLLLGMLFCGIVELFFLEGKNQLMKHPFWSKFMVIIAVEYFLFWMVLFPIEIFVFERGRRKDQELQKLTIKDMVGLPFGAANPNANIPKWIKIPVLTVLYLLAGVFVLFFAMLLISYIVSKIMGS